MKKGLAFREDGQFKIVQFTDLHIGDGVEGLEKDELTIALMHRVIDQEQPDLILLTGDQHWSHEIKDPIRGYIQAISPAIQSGIPWAAVFGNHDSEGEVTRDVLMRLMQESDTCLAERGPNHLSGVGNYVLTIEGARDPGTQAVLYCFDSGNLAPDPLSGYEWLHADQVAWYVEESHKLTRSFGGPLPALAFFHIPLPEYEQAVVRGTFSGNKLEQVCCPVLNSGMFAAMIECADVMGTFVGHDHDNDYIAHLNGIRLCYGRASGYNTYGSLQKGARVIVLEEGVRDFKTWIRQADGSVVFHS